MPGYSKYLFTENIKKEFICIFCDKILKNPLECKKCNVYFCLTCPKNIKNPHENHNLVPANKYFSEKLGKIEMCCKFWFNDCKKRIKIGEISNHLKECDKKTKEKRKMCVWSCKKCGKNCFVKEIEDLEHNCYTYLTMQIIEKDLIFQEKIEKNKKLTEKLQKNKENLAKNELNSHRILEENTKLSQILAELQEEKEKIIIMKKELSKEKFIEIADKAYKKISFKEKELSEINFYKHFLADLNKKVVFKNAAFEILDKLQKTLFEITAEYTELKENLNNEFQKNIYSTF